MNGHQSNNSHKPRYKRIMLKLSGEALSGDCGGIDPDQQFVRLVFGRAPISARSQVADQ